MNLPVQISPVKPISRRWIGAALLLLAATSSCLSPRHSPIVVPDHVPAVWTSPSPATSPALVDRWWMLLADPTLDKLVDTALAGNLDIQQAAARVKQARASSSLARSEGGPSIDTSASLRRSHAAAGGADQNHFQAGFDASWEADLFGRIGQGVKAGDSDLRGAEFALADIQLSLVAEISTTLAEYRSLQQRILIAHENLAMQKQSAELTRKRFETGLSGELDSLNAMAQVATTAAQIPQLESAARLASHSLGILCGQEPSAVLESLRSEGKQLLSAPAMPAAGVPSDLLQRRPDVRQAGAAVDAAHARTGVSAAELYPRLQVGASVGVQNTDGDKWLDPLREFWSAGPSVSWPLFDRGRTRANLVLRQALEEQTVLKYRQTVLNALREVEDAMAASSWEAERRARLGEAVAANLRAVELSNRLHKAGQIDFLSVLTTQRSLLSVQDALAQSELASIRLWISFCKSLGGGPGTTH